MNILVAFGTRPEAIKLFPVIHALKRNPDFNVIVCVTAQHREMLDQVLQIANIEPDLDLDIMRPNQTLPQMTSRILKDFDEVLRNIAPDRVMVQGDTTTAMAAALSAFYRKIPVDHVEAGLRSGDIYSPWPEEVNRKVVGSIAALHFAPTDRAAEALANENVPRERIFGGWMCFPICDRRSTGRCWTPGTTAVWCWSPRTGARISTAAWNGLLRRCCRSWSVRMYR
jgi:UDP-N-acetylglucosamine 2-epimerase (non-hydrolysing)